MSDSMMHDEGASTPDDLIGRIQQATNDHDLESLVACFNEGYLSEIPVHPARSFQGRDQVRRNWTQIFAAVPDLNSRLIRSSVAGDTGWAEWEWTGTRRDGQPHLMRGVTILGLAEGGAAWARFYMEPVDQAATGIDAAVAQAVAR
ncbi:MAG: nuclear transport factor 2 family protein [Candidatus Limnocylindrales bacterium]